MSSRIRRALPGSLLCTLVAGCSTHHAGGTSADAPGAIDSATSKDAPGNSNCNGKVPLVYNTATDRMPHMVATPPTLPAAGGTFTDPTYGSKILRLTDTTTQGATVSFHVANEFWGNDWNTDGTRFYLQASTSGFMFYDFDPATMQATRTMDMAHPGKPLSVPVAPGGFSRTDPDTFYGIVGDVIVKYDFATQTTTNLLDLKTVVPGLTGYTVGLNAAANGMVAVMFGGPQQDEMPYLALYDTTTGVHHILDVVHSTLDGTALPTPIGGGLHALHLDSSGQYLSFIVANPTVSTTPNWRWDTATNTITSAPYPGALGYGAWISGGGIPHESYSWQLHTFASATATPLISPAPSPADGSASASVSWQNATSGGLSPVIVETMRQPADTGPWRAWDEEILAVRTDGTQSTVWRFAHTFNTYTGTIYSDNFYYLFIPRVSQNGQFVLFDSNWNATLGTDASGQPRTDAFIVALSNDCGP